MATPAVERPGDGRGAWDGDERQQRPLREHGLLIATFGTLFSLATAAAARKRRLPERVSARDIALGGLATHKLSRLVAKDKVTAPVRAPFTYREGEGRPGEVEESPRGRGLRYVIGELLVCPFCLDQWIGAAYTLGLVFTPRFTRLVGSMMSIVALSDFLQIAYKAAENRREPS